MIEDKVLIRVCNSVCDLLQWVCEAYWDWMWLMMLVSSGYVQYAVRYILPTIAFTLHVLNSAAMKSTPGGTISPILAPSSCS